MRGRLLILCSLIAAPSGGAADWWAMRPLVSSTRHHSIDGFVNEARASHSLHGSPPADARTVIRRATFDLTGLPPTPEDVAAFIAESDDAGSMEPAYAALLDRLLASPHYGEQWARHWLDIARYSDTKGYVYAREEKRWVHAAAYRDWAVRALNADMPYDRFVRLQIAADQIAPPRSPDLAAMGFLTLGRRFLGVTHDIIDDRIDVVTRGMLGLTVACARCHDHKYDPIPTRDYYALYGVFQGSAEAVVPCGDGGGPEIELLNQKNADLRTKRREEQMARTRGRLRDYLDAQSELSKYPPEGFDQILDEKDLNPFIVHRFALWLQRRELKPETLKVLGDSPLGQAFAGEDSPVFVPDEHIANIEMFFPTGVITELWKSQGDADRAVLQMSSPPGYATILTDRAVPSTPRVFLRGNPLAKAEEVPRQFLSVFGKQEPFSKGSGRLELANAIADPRNPLTARVMVNRVWQHHFGRGLVTTPSDFGTRAVPPSHPELLDWLTLRFIESGWSLKCLHRVIMLSATYRQASLESGAIRGENVESERAPLSSSPRLAIAQSSADADNRFLSRMTAHRLSFEEARDAWLAATGELDLRIGGKPDALFGKQNKRRTLYTLVDRETVPGVMRAFDFANPDLSIPQRSETTVPQQALFGMNHPFIAARAAALVAGLPAGDASARVTRLYSRLYQRQPTATELNSALGFVHADIAPHPQPNGPSAWSYGYGAFDSATGRVKSFTLLPHFNGTAWQGGDQWPDEKLGWAQITAAGGHPGNDRQHAVIRRWKAPHDGAYSLTSTLIHEPDAGDGIRAFVSHSARGLLRSTSLKNASEPLDLDAIVMSKGDTLDFITDIRDGLNSDQFLWSPQLTLTGTTGSGGDVTGEKWSAEKDFAGETHNQLDSWQQLAQVLMLANEFMFVD